MSPAVTDEAARRALAIVQSPEGMERAWAEICARDPVLENGLWEQIQAALGALTMIGPGLSGRHATQLVAEQRRMAAFMYLLVAGASDGRPAQS